MTRMILFTSLNKGNKTCGYSLRKLGSHFVLLLFEATVMVTVWTSKWISHAVVTSLSTSKIWSILLDSLNSCCLENFQVYPAKHSEQ